MTQQIHIEIFADLENDIVGVEGELSNAFSILLSPSEFYEDSLLHALKTVEKHIGAFNHYVKIKEG